MNPIQVGNLVLYVGKNGFMVLGTVTEVLVSGEAYMDPFYKILWNDPEYGDMTQNTLYDQNQVVEWRHTFLEYETT